jgi:DNA-binding winged helix-turn-helix (wHTH) protein/tetratricopeptide (TPR) repeat protein
MTIHSFGPFRLDAEAEILFLRGEPVTIGRRGVAVLRILLENAGSPVSKTALIDRAWSGLSVEESNLPVQVAAVRKALGGQPGGERWIETLPRRGYRFVGPINASQRRAAAARRHARPAKEPASSRPETAEVPRRLVEPEQRQLSILSGELICTDLDLEDIRDAVAAYHRCFAEIGAAFRGSVIRHLGNMVLLAFGYPAAHENDAEQAVRAGLALCAAVEQLKIGRQVLLRCRVGIATGLTVIGDLAGEARDYSAVGDALDVAARLQISAQPATVIIDAATRRMIGGLFNCQDLGEIGGLAKRLPAFQVLCPSTLDSRFDALHAPALAPFVGREEELASIARRWADVERGHGQVVVITGEPGIGKSRLMRAARDGLGDEPHAALVLNCSPYHQGSALHPISAHLVRAAGITHQDVDESRVEKLASVLRQSGGASEEETELFSAVLSIRSADRSPRRDQTPRRLKERTLGALTAWVDRLCLRAPVLMLVEDLQWMDPTSLEWLTGLVELADRSRLLVLTTARPEFVAPWPNHRHILNLALSRLNAVEGRALIAGITRGKSLPPDVVDRLVVRTDGVPLFVEELTKTVLESGLLREAEDRYELAAPLPALAIPSTLHASLLARLDRLEAARNVAQIGAVIGREFSYALISTVSGMPEAQLQTALSQLVSTGLVFPRGAPPDAIYVFKHALVQDAAYSSLIRTRRQHLHGAIGRAIEAEFPHIVPPDPDTGTPDLEDASLMAIVAHHFTEAGVGRRAVDYWLMAGEHALKRSANIEAAGHLTRGIELIDLLPTSPALITKDFRLHLALGAALQATRGVGAPETVRAYTRAQDLLRRRGSLRDHVAVLRGLWNGYFIRGRLREALGVLGHCKSLATRDNNEEALALTNRLMGISVHMMGRFIEAKSHLEQSLAFYTANQERDASAHFAYLTDDRVGAMSYFTRTLWLLGHPETARRIGSEALADARMRGHAMTIATALLGNLFVAMGTHDCQVAVIVGELLKHSLENRLASYEFWATLFQGVLMAARGNDQGIEIMRRAMATADNVGSAVSRPAALGQLARALARLDRLESACEALDQAIAAAQAMEAREYAAELRRLRGAIFLRMGKVRDAERELREAITIAREQHARWWELRTATSLARLWRDQGKHAQARDLLAPIYGWFTEGFDTLDLKKAKALLDELCA